MYPYGTSDSRGCGLVYICVWCEGFLCISNHTGTEWAHLSLRFPGCVRCACVCVGRNDDVVQVKTLNWATLIKEEVHRRRR